MSKFLLHKNYLGPQKSDTNRVSSKVNCYMKALYIRIRSLIESRSYKRSLFLSKHFLLFPIMLIRFADWHRDKEIDCSIKSTSNAKNDHKKFIFIHYPAHHLSGQWKQSGGLHLFLKASISIYCCLLSLTQFLFLTDLLFTLEVHALSHCFSCKSIFPYSL